MRNREKRLLRELWRSFSYVMGSKDWGQHARKLLTLTVQESKDHNRGRPEGVPHDMTIEQEARFFALLRVMEYLSGDKAPKPEEFTRTQTSCFYAYSLVSQYRGDLETWREENPEAWQLLLWDYSVLVKGRTEVPYSDYLQEVEIEPASSGKGWFLRLTYKGSHRKYYGPSVSPVGIEKAVKAYVFDTQVSKAESITA